MPGAPRIGNPARSITWLVSVTIYCTIFNNNSPPSCQLLRDGSMENASAENAGTGKCRYWKLTVLRDDGI